MSKTDSSRENNLISPRIYQCKKCKSWRGGMVTVFSKMEGKIITNQLAYTLLEIMIAVLIFGIIMLTIFSSFRSFMLSTRMIQDQISQLEKGDALLNRIVTDMRALRISLPPEYTEPATRVDIGNADSDPFRLKGEEIGVNGSTFSTLTFASLYHIAFGGDTRTGVARIRYYVRPNPGRGFDLCRSDTLDLVKDSEASDCDPVICKNITEFTLIYRDEEGEEYRYWDSESDAFDYATPVAIHIAVAFETDQNHDIGQQRPADGSLRDPHRGGIGKVETMITMPLFRKGDNS